MKLGQKLERARNIWGYSKKELAAMAGIQESTYGKYERNVHSPTVDTLILIATALHTTADDLLEGVDQMKGE